MSLVQLQIDPIKSQINNNYMYCSNCGLQNEDNAYKCVKCQALLHPEASQKTASVPDNNAEALKYIIPIGRSGIAIAAGYIGLFSILLIPAPISFVFGLWALSDLKKHPEKIGKGRAYFAIIMGIIFSIIWVIYYFSES